MNEITAITKAAKSLFRKRKAVFGLIDSIAISIYFKVLGSMGELAPGSIGTLSLLHEIFAEGAFNFGGAIDAIMRVVGIRGAEMMKISLIVVGGGLGLVVEVGVVGGGDGRMEGSHELYLK